MDVFLVRHGQTEGNVAMRHQHQNSSLNEIGKMQAELVARRIAKRKPTNIVTSTNLRAVETAKIIAERCGRLVPETNPLFEELKRPRWLIGNHFVSLVTVLYIIRWFYNLKIKGDGESYAQFLERIIEARKLLESLPENSKVVVVSHSVFINLFLEHLCFDKRMTLWRAVRRFIKVLTLRNASMIHLRHAVQEKQNVCSWQVVKSYK